MLSFRNLTVQNSFKNLVSLCWSSRSSVATSILSSDNSSPTGDEKPKIFSKEINIRRSEAERSVLVTLNRETSSIAAYRYLKQFGKIKSYQNDNVTKKRRLLVEFDEASSVKELLTQCRFQSSEGMPVTSVYLHFKTSRETSNVVDDNDAVDGLHYSDICSLMSKANSVTEQCEIFHESNKITDLEIRIRFLLCHQIERMLTGIFPMCQSLPFGSTVNGFGRKNCDLDVILQFHPEIKTKDSVEKMLFETKNSIANRMQSQRTLDTLAALLHNFIPGCINVQRILHARVPILKFHHSLSDVDCDISIINLSGFYMSEILHIYSQMDRRVCPLLFTVRKWAEVNNLTNIFPGLWITNFSMLLMVIFFFQRKKILLPIDALTKLAGKDDEISTMGIDCTYLRDIESLPKSENDDNLSDLLKEFFLYYGNFDFKRNGISIKRGEEILKPNYSPLYIQNPLENMLNVSKNVKLRELEKITACMQSALWKLESFDRQNLNDPWGLCKLFENSSASRSTPKGKKYSIELDSLFADTFVTDSSDVEDSSKFKSLIDNVTQKF